MTQNEREALRYWEEYKENLSRATPVDHTKTAAQIKKHREELEADPPAWMKFFFPSYAKYDFAPFQIKAIWRIIQNDEWYEVLSWSRELAKSTIVMFIVLYLVLTERKKNTLLTSNNKDNAIRLLAPYKANLEANNRIRQYYGDQISLGSWKEDEFITKKGAAFRALGAGMSPRGSRNESIRPDIFLMDDFDTDEECRNPDIVDKKWEWFEKALYPARSISEPTLVLWCGNIIATDSCVTRAGKMAKHWDIINVRMVNIRKPDPTEDYARGTSVWPEKNTEEQIDEVLSNISLKAIMGEYFNHVISEGTIFKEVKWGKMPPLKKFQFLVIYGDPTQSENKSKQKGKKGSRKAVWLMGGIGDVLYIFKGFILKRSTNDEFTECFFDLEDYVGGETPLYAFLENNSLQDPFYEQVFKPLFSKKRRERKSMLTVAKDERRKPDKAVRIEAALEPLVRVGRLVLNEAEKGDPNMVELVNEFKYFTLGLPYPADGIDTLEGGLWIIQHKRAEMAPADYIPIEAVRGGNKHRR